MKNFTIIIGITLILSCQDVKNIVIKGQVVDKTLNIPIPNAEVLILCWFTIPVDDASYVKKNYNY